MIEYIIRGLDHDWQGLEGRKIINGKLERFGIPHEGEMDGPFIENAKREIEERIKYWENFTVKRTG